MLTEWEATLKKCAKGAALEGTSPPLAAATSEQAVDSPAKGPPFVPSESPWWGTDSDDDGLYEQD